MQNHKELKDQLKGYNIDGDIVELWNVLLSNAFVLTTLNDILSVLSDDKANYIRVGYGETLEQAYKSGLADDMICRLVYVYFPTDGLRLAEFNNFISSLDKDIIWGCSIDNTIVCGFKLVMIFN